MDDAALLNSFRRGVYLYTPDGVLTHFSGCLVEGLTQLGVPVRTNAKAVTSRPVSMPLADIDLTTLNSEPVSGFDAYLVDISTNNAFVPLEGVNDVPVGYITTSDISVFCEIPGDFVLFAAHDSTHAVKPGRRVPIAFGLPQQLIDTTNTLRAFSDREAAALHSFRPTLHQGVRALLDMTFVPILEQSLPINRVNVPPKHYLKALQDSALCLAYGGDFYSPIAGNTWFEKNQPDVYQLHSFDRLEAAAVLRWDSWRFWEAMACGCVAVHLDFRAYGFNLPVQPEPWTHYIPVDLADLIGSVQAIMDAQARWPDIAAAGRAWAVEHYAPAPTARRVLEALSQ